MTLKTIVKYLLAVYLVVLPTGAWGLQMYNNGAADPMLWMVVIVGGVVGLYVVFGPQALKFALDTYERFRGDAGG